MMATQHLRELGPRKFRRQVNKSWLKPLCNYDRDHRDQCLRSRHAHPFEWKWRRSAKRPSFAAKDLFDVAGYPTGCGNHDWARHSQIPSKHAWAVQTLLDAGATLVGKTITDEISLGILGESRFDGTPLNTLAPDRVPGGSSSGSAAAVAGNLCDFALGSDTGGSVRVPASFCGVYGIRPTHGRVNSAGLIPG